MATATLKKNGPRRINTHGHIFERGVDQTVSAEVGRSLENDARFDVKFDKAELAVPLAASQQQSGSEKPQRPESKEARIAAIRDAIGELDEDNEDHWTNDGKPDARALTSILGWQVTSPERDEALAQPDGQKLATEQAAAGGKGRRGGVKIVRKNGAPAPLDTGEKGQSDPTTEGAVEV